MTGSDSRVIRNGHVRSPVAHFPGRLTTSATSLIIAGTALAVLKCRAQVDGSSTGSKQTC
jgi:hypothetical protein